MDDQPSLRAIELACALGIHELVVIDLPITENVAKGDLAQVQAGGVGDAPDATVRRDFQAAAVIGQTVGHLEGTIGLLLCEQPRPILSVDRGVCRRESESETGSDTCRESVCKNV